MTTRCPVCSVRVGPCLDEHGAAIGQYHDARVRAEAARVRAEAVGRIDHAAEALRLRSEQRKAAMRELMAARRSKP